MARSAFGTAFGGASGCLAALGLFCVIGIGGCIVAAGGCIAVTGSAIDEAAKAVENNARVAEERRLKEESPSAPEGQERDDPTRQEDLPDIPTINLQPIDSP